MARFGYLQLGFAKRLQRSDVGVGLPGAIVDVAVVKAGLGSHVGR